MSKNAKAPKTPEPAAVAPPGKFLVYPFTAVGKDGPGHEVPEPPGTPFGAAFARQFTLQGNWHFYTAEGELIATDKDTWDHERMKGFLPPSIFAIQPELEAKPPVETPATPAPAPVATAGVTAPKIGVYPKAVEHRYLKTSLNTGEINEYAQTLARIVRNIEDIEIDKKAANDRFAGQLSDAKKEQKEVSHLVSDGFREKKIECQWHFESSGIDSTTRLPVYHPDMKTLVRLDNGDVVEIKPMTDEDFKRRELPFSPVAGEPSATPPPAEPTPEPEKVSEEPPPGDEAEVE